jgi:hypothetical protein
MEKFAPPCQLIITIITKYKLPKVGALHTILNVVLYVFKIYNGHLLFKGTIGYNIYVFSFIIALKQNW